MEVVEQNSLEWLGLVGKTARVDSKRGQMHALA
jgi:hypothetical protein